MDDTLICPICQSRFFTEQIFSVKTSQYIKRICNISNHFLYILFNKSTQKVELMKFSTDPNFSTYVENDYINSISHIDLMRNSIPMTISCPLIIPDFPNFPILKGIINKYTIIS